MQRKGFREPPKQFPEGFTEWKHVVTLVNGNHRISSSKDRGLLFSPQQVKFSNMMQRPRKSRR